MPKFLKPHTYNQGLLSPKGGDPDGFVSKDGMWAAIPWAGKKKGFCIIYNGNQVHREREQERRIQVQDQQKVVVT